MGTDDYITKPVNQEEFLYRIKALLHRAKIANERKIVIGDVVIDYDSSTVTKGDMVQELPQKEFLLLYKLLSYPGKIFTRIRLMDEIWGVDSETDRGAAPRKRKRRQQKRNHCIFRNTSPKTNTIIGL